MISRAVIWAERTVCESQDLDICGWSRCRKNYLTSCFTELGSTVINPSPSRIDKYIVLVQKPDSFPKRWRHHETWVIPNWKFPLLHCPLNVLLSDKLSSIHGLLGMDAISTSTACRDFNTAMQQSLTCTGLLRGQPRAEHSPSTLESLANRLKKLKIGVRRGMRKDLSCQQSAMRQEAAFRRTRSVLQDHCAASLTIWTVPQSLVVKNAMHTYRTHTSSHLQRFRSPQTGFNANQFHPSHFPST